MESTKYISFLEDYLNETNPIKPLDLDLSDEYNNKTVLITGAAGSIGSALSQRLTKYNYKKLILLDNAESSLYFLQLELNDFKTNLIEYIVADIRDEEKMNFVIQNEKPDIIIHTAAYKQLPLMEKNPYEVIKVNLLATKVLADLAISNHVEKFIFISTDKAVNPKSIMGATKRIAELYFNQFATSKTSFYTTRFGNVLGSNGSVIPLFIKQIKNSLPLVITHQNVSRYFITIKHASNLILETSILNLNNATLSFNMGKPIKIIDIAKALIRFSKKETIKINFCGLREGEKINEELIAEHETLENTNHDAINLITSTFDVNNLNFKIEDLSQIQPSTSREDINKKIKAILPNFGN